MTKEELVKRIINNDALFRNIYVFEQPFDIIPNDHCHIGAAISFQDLQELRHRFLEELVDTVIDWVYSSDKYRELQNQFIAKGKSNAGAFSEVHRKAIQKFRTSDDHLVIQGQLGELLLFHFLQRYMQAIPLLRKMSITTSSSHERYGADAIHYKIDGNKNIIVLGEAKAYTSKYKFAEAFNDSIDSILHTYENIRLELNLYLHEDFLDKEMNEIANSFLSNTLSNVEIQLVCLVLFHENEKIEITNEEDIRQQILCIIKERYSSINKNMINVEIYPILRRITYIAFPIWKFDELAKEFQRMLK